MRCCWTPGKAAPLWCSTDWSVRTETLVRPEPGGRRPPLLPGREFAELAALLLLQAEAFQQVVARRDPVVGAEETHGFVHAHVRGQARCLQLHPDKVAQFARLARG